MPHRTSVLKPVSIRICIQLHGMESWLECLCQQGFIIFLMSPADIVQSRQSGTTVLSRTEAPSVFLHQPSSERDFCLCAHCLMIPRWLHHLLLHICIPGRKERESIRSACQLILSLTSFSESSVWKLAQTVLSSDLKLQWSLGGSRTIFNWACCCLTQKLWPTSMGEGEEILQGGSLHCVLR